METKAFSWKLGILIVLVVGLLVAGLSAFAQTRGWGMQLLTGAASSTPTTAIAGVATSYNVPAAPVRLIIPAIGVDANVQSVGDWWRDPSVMGIPTNFTDVGWYNKGPKPGEPGSAVIDGHLDGHDVKEAVFYNLQNLKPGDDVQVVDSKGVTLHFKVVATKLYNYDAPTADVFNPDVSKVRLNLITCAGDWIQGQYNQRVVVFTELTT